MESDGRPTLDWLIKEGFAEEVKFKWKTKSEKKQA